MSAADSNARRAPLSWEANSPTLQYCQDSGIGPHVKVAFLTASPLAMILIHQLLMRDVGLQLLTLAPMICPACDSTDGSGSCGRCFFLVPDAWLHCIATPPGTQTGRNALSFLTESVQWVPEPNFPSIWWSHWHFGYPQKVWIALGKPFRKANFS